MKYIVSPLFALALLIGPVGCATVGSTIEDHEPLAKAAVLYATLKVIDQNQERAARVIEITSLVRQSIGSEEATSLDALESLVIGAIQWDKLKVEEQVLIYALIGEVKLQLENKLGDKILASENLLIVDKILGWVEDGARMTTG